MAADKICERLRKVIKMVSSVDVLDDEGSPKDAGRSRERGGK